MEFELSPEYKERFEVALKCRDKRFISSSLDGVNPADITTLLDEFNSDQCKFVFSLLPLDVDAAILNGLDEDVRKDFLEFFPNEEIAGFIEFLDSDDAADIVLQFNLKDREEIISLVKSDEKSAHIMDLIRYDEDVAGGLMAKELIKANHNWTVRRCIEEIRKQAENVEKIYSIYVVDEIDTLIGKVSLKKLIISGDTVKVSDIFDDDIIVVNTYLEKEEVISIMQKYDLEVVPVINPKGKLVGRITIDDVLDVITELAEEERQIMSGISSDIEEDDDLWSISKARLPWLVIGMGGGLIAARITNLFREDIAIITGLALFIPLITATGGNVGIQSSSLIVQSLANPNAFESGLWSRFFKMLIVAVINGTILAVIVFGAIILLFQEPLLAYTVGIALFNVVILASLTGTITPLVLNKFGINPALASGPFITTANDLLGLAVYFSVAHAIYNL